MRFMDYTNDKNGTSYSPLVDFLGPVALHPPHCYKIGDDLDNFIESPIIAYVKNDNDVERDLIAMVNQTFKT